MRDRVVHHAVYRIFYPIFDESFIYDSYSCRIGKGTHKAVQRLEYFSRKVSKNYTRVCWSLKCDIKKFFASVKHEILFGLIKKKVKDQNSLSLILQIISSFQKPRERESSKNDHRKKFGFQEILRSAQDDSGGVGLPIGNLTSQLFANIYLDELDQFIKHKLEVKFYLRYCDDFLILHQDRDYLLFLVGPIQEFLKNKLKLSLHPDKIIIKKLKQGIDFLGYVVLPHHRVLRNKTKKRMLKRINQDNSASYLGLLKHCDSYRLGIQIKKLTGEKF